MTLLRVSGGGAVFSVGSIGWMSCLSDGGLREPRVSRHVERA